MRKSFLLAATALAVVGAPLSVSAQTATARAAPDVAVSPEIRAAVNAPGRTPENKLRDSWRHPAETLSFFGLKPGMTVVEVSPGGGWYTEILAPAVGPSGRVYAAHTNPAASERAAAAVKRYQDKLEADPVYKNVTVTVMGKDSYDIAPAGSADMVLTFRNVHSWMGPGFAQEAFNAFAKALKPGGVLGVVEHRLPESGTQDPKGGSGYVKESEVIKMAEKAGFRLAARSEINANPADTANWPKGVWTLPPNYAEGPETKAKYDAIGESDRMTLRFVKK